MGFRPVMRSRCRMKIVGICRSTECTREREENVTEQLRAQKWHGTMCIVVLYVLDSGAWLGSLLACAVV